jgi:hypothetical protein
MFIDVYTFPPLFLNPFPLLSLLVVAPTAKADGIGSVMK